MAAIVVGFAVELELSPDRVADPSFHAAERLSFALAFVKFSPVAGTAWCIEADSSDRGDVVASSCSTAMASSRLFSVSS